MSRGLAVLAASLALAGCAVGGAAGPDIARPVDAAAVGRPTAEAPVRRERTLKATDASPVPTTEWPAVAPRAVILALHGYGDYGPSTFAAAARSWAAAGITTYAPDQRGFGRGPTRGRWPGANALIGDARGYARQIRARHPDLPLILLGHSMGGGIALAAAQDAPEVDGLVLAAPAIWGSDALNPLQRLGAWLAAAVVPDKRFTGEGVVRIRASDNIDALRALGRDPYYLRAPSARELLGLVRVVDAAAAAAPGTDTPALLLLGEKDEIVPNARVRRIFETLPGAGAEITYPEGWHLLFRDLQAARVHDDVAAWALARTLARTLAPTLVPAEALSERQAARP